MMARLLFVELWVLAGIGLAQARKDLRGAMWP